MSGKQRAHTPAPWIQWAGHPEIYAGDIDLNEPGFLSAKHAIDRVASCEPDDLERETDEIAEAVAMANAAHIVRCVNSHEQLVEALRGETKLMRSLLVDDCWEIKLTMDERGVLEAACQQAERALAEATKEE